MHAQHVYFPAKMIAGLMMLMMGLLLLSEHLVQRDVTLVNKFFLGMDYQDFYIGGALLESGQSPYLPERYVTPLCPPS